MGAHAILSPSSAKRWLSCTPSARMEEQYESKTSNAADEGTLAHALCEATTQLKLKLITKEKYKSEVNKAKKNPLYAEEMLDYANDYALYLFELFVEAQTRSKDAKIFLETRLDMSAYVPEGFGTGDCVIVADGVLDFVDYKHGKGVYVEVEENPQMKLYALGALSIYGMLYDIHTIRMTIYQPRLNNISTWECSIEALYEWAEGYLKPRAIQAFKGLGDFVPGEHCQFCKHKPRCRALADECLEIAKHDFALVETLSDAEISDILEKAPLLKNWIGGVEEYALEQAKSGKEWPGLKLVEGRSNRKYADENAIIKSLRDAGFQDDKILKPVALRPITELEKEITKPKFQEYVSGYVVKPAGAPTLVSVSDKRPAIKSSEGATSAFEGIQIED